MRKVSIDDIRKMNELYLQLHTYAGVARETGFSASTVRRYIREDFSLIDENKIHHFDPNTDMPEENYYLMLFRGVDNYGDLCVLSDSEKDEIKELWEELSL